MLDSFWSSGFSETWQRLEPQMKERAQTIRTSAARDSFAAFAEQLALAKRIGKPVVMHTREAEDDTAAMLVEAGKEGIRGVLHCHSQYSDGKATVAEMAAVFAWYFSMMPLIDSASIRPTWHRWPP